MRQVQIRKGYTKNGKRRPRKRDAEIRQEYYDPMLRKARKARDRSH